MTQADQEERFPRTVYDESGRYTVARYGQYEARSPLIKRYAAIVYIRRDLDSALEMIQVCAADEQCPGSSLAKRCLWISAVVTYSKALRGGKGRKAFDAADYVTRHLSNERLRLHKYLLKLRDRMIAHDDSIGATKKLSIYLPPNEPKYSHEFGIGGGNRQIGALGSDIAKELVPHFEWMAAHFAILEAETRADAQATMLETQFSDVVLVNPYEEEKMEVSIEELVGPPTT